MKMDREGLLTRGGDEDFDVEKRRIIAARCVPEKTLWPKGWPREGVGGQAGLWEWGKDYLRAVVGQ